MGKRVAAIDVGTNTVLMVVAELAADGTIVTIGDEQRIIRIGEGLLRTGRIGDEAVSRLIETLREFAHLANDHYAVDQLDAVGTSAFRRATNGAEVVRRVHEVTGIRIEIIDGDTEAAMTYAGAVSGIDARGTTAVIDVGGGSTEVIVGRGMRVLRARSVDEGVVIARETFYPALPPPAGTRERVAAHMRDKFVNELPAGMWEGVDNIVAVAGTPTTLAAIALNLAAYDAAAIDGYRLTLDMLRTFAQRFHAMTREELLALPTVDPLRADLLPAGTLILIALLELAGAASTIVSTRGVRSGLALRALDAAR